MRAVVCRKAGSPGITSVEVCESPELNTNHVRIEVHSAGVSFANLLVLRGKHQNRKDPPFTPGTEVAGIVTESSATDGRLKLGDRVVAGVRSGGYASEAVAPCETAFLLPPGIDFDSAVQFPTIYATAYGSLKWRARLRHGETVLVHGAAGGSGLAAIEIAKALGGRVIACAGTSDKVEVAKAHGADDAFNYNEHDIRDHVLALTEGRGADVVFDPVGGDCFTQSLRCVAPEARLIPMGFASGSIPQIPANILLVKNVSVVGFYLGYYMGWGRQQNPPESWAVLREAFEQMFDWFCNARLRPRTHGTFSLENYGSALDVLTSRSVLGRVALHPQ